MLIRTAVVGLLLTVTAACTSSAAPTTPASAAGGPTQTSAASPADGASSTASGAAARPTVAVKASSCPWVKTSVVHSTLGQRLGRITVLRSGGAVVGCRFYPQTQPDDQCDATCLQGEDLPGPNQPVTEIRTYRYASTVAAHNAFVLASRAGTRASTVPLAAALPGITYRTRFDPPDGATDWACGFSIATTRVLIRSDINDSAGQGEVTRFATVVARAF